MVKDRWMFKYIDWDFVSKRIKQDQNRFSGVFKSEHSLLIGI